MASHKLIRKHNTVRSPPLSKKQFLIVGKEDGLQSFPHTQREVTLFGRQYSDDEDEEQFAYGHTRSELMGTRLAKEESSTRSRSEPIKKLMKAAPRVIEALT